MHSGGASTVLDGARSADAGVPRAGPPTGRRAGRAARSPAGARRRPAAAVALAALAAVVLVGCDRSSTPSGNQAGPATSGPSMPAGVDGGPASRSAGPGPSAPQAPPPDPGPVRCPTATRQVRDADGLTAALKGAKPGDSIALADGRYVGAFVVTASGTAAAAVFLCGGPGAVLEGNGTTSGYVLHLDGASWWRLAGFTVRNGQKGVVADRSQHSVVQGLTVEDIGDEGIHLRSFSSDNLVVGNTVRRTGQRRAKFGEGIYVGSATSNWQKYSGGQPDRSDRNVLRGNSVSATTAESIDIKEGTTGGVAVGNTFDGSALTGADSWVDVKGNGWLIQGNTGRRSPKDGFQTHEVAAGWGTANVFRANTAILDGPGYGIALTPVKDNRVTCDNRAVNARAGLTNIACG